MLRRRDGGGSLARALATASHHVSEGAVRRRLRDWKGSVGSSPRQGARYCAGDVAGERGVVLRAIEAYNRDDWDAFFKTWLRASLADFSSRESVLGAASSDLIRFGQSLEEFRETWESRSAGAPRIQRSPGDPRSGALDPAPEGAWRDSRWSFVSSLGCSQSATEQNRAWSRCTKSAGSPRSRRAVGVGDVAGERGAHPFHL